jgi:hypothetical protein
MERERLGGKPRRRVGAETVKTLEACAKTDHLRVTVTGDRDGDTIKVKSLKM